MTNLVEITVRIKDDATQSLKAITKTASNSGTAAGKGFSDSFSKQMGTGVTGSLFGKSGASVQSTAQKAGQDAGLGFSRGLLQKFQQQMGSGLLSGLFGTSGGQKLFGSAGSTVVQSAQQQGQAVGQGLANGLNSSISKASQQANSSLAGMLSGGGGAQANAQKSGQQAGSSYASGFLNAVRSKFASSNLFSGLGKKGSGGGGNAGGAGSLIGTAAAFNPGGVAGGALPGMLGLSAGLSSIVGLGASLLGTLPAISAVGAGLGVLGAGFIALYKGSAQAKAQITSDFKSMGSVIVDAAKPLQGPMLGALKQLDGFVKSIGPELGKIFSAAVPLIQPLLKGIESLVSGLLPGLLAIVKAAGPAFGAFAGILGTLGRDLGTMLSAFAPAIKSSAVLMTSFLNGFSGLFPVIAQFASTFATILGPVFKTFAGSLAVVAPVISAIASVIGQFAGAVMTDLAGVLGAVGALLKGIAPSLNLLAKVMGQVFTTMENAGVFAILGDAIENLAKPLSTVINLFITQLAPILPVIMTLISKLAGILITLLSAGLTVILGMVATLLKKFPMLVPILGAITVGWLALNAVLAINPWVAIITAVIVVVGLIAKYHQQIWNTIQTVWNDIKNFFVKIWDDILSFAKQFWPLLLGPTGVILMFHSQITAAIKSAWNTIYSFLKSTWGSIESTAQTAWNTMKSAVTTTWGTIVKFFDGIPGDITAAFKGAGTLLTKIGGDIINGLKAGAVAVWNSVVTFFKNLPSDILNALGIHSPPDWAIQAGKDIMNGLGIGMTQAHTSAANAANALKNKVVGGIGGVPTTGSAAEAQTIAMKMAALIGWTGAQWTALNDVAMRESGWSMTAQNPTSGAYGIAQFIDGPSEYAQYGGNANTLSGQLVAFFNYIKQRYGTPSAAWAHEESYGWYSGGGVTPSGWAMVGEHGRELVKLPGGSTVVPAGATAQMVAGGASAGGVIQLVVSSGGQSEFEQFMLQAIRKWVRVKGGGSVQKAFGRT